MVGYYRSFCPNFSSVVAPLSGLLQQKVKFEWSLACRQAFGQVKMLLSTAPVAGARRVQVNQFPFSLTDPI
jgi:hypothetical protein